jgi:hypothetical protein
MTPTLRPPDERSPSSPADGRAVRVYFVSPAPPDYPAAHSMDTIWYGVDGKGNVGVFDAGSSGPVPRKAGHESGELLRILRHLGWKWEPNEDEDEDEEDFDRDEALKAAADLGLFVFVCISWET